MDRTMERVLDYALYGINTELRTLDEDGECFKELYEFYIKVYDEYEMEMNKNIML